MNPTQTIPSLLSKFGIRSKPMHNPKMPKEPFSPSRSRAVTRKHCSKVESLELIGRKQPAYNRVDCPAS
jgi:hypothetical protein